jgi:hypothetical protein
MTSASPIGAGVTLSRFIAPRVTSRSRSGSADAEANPARRAAEENDGHHQHVSNGLPDPAPSPTLLHGQPQGRRPATGYCPDQNDPRASS